jgi:ElaB/YqjD/DUF883 family membrane-anchored ribosome-binding protein
MTTQGSQTIERVKDGLGDVVEKTRDAVNDGFDSVHETIDETANDLDRRYRRTASKLQRLSDRARDQVEGVKETYTRASKNLARLNQDLNEYVSDNPRRSVLIAAGVGFLVGWIVLRRSERA